MIEVFKRRAWKRNKSWPGGYEPHVGRRTHVCYVDTPDQARAICKQHNDNRKTKTDTFCEFWKA